MSAIFLLALLAISGCAQDNTAVIRSGGKVEFQDPNGGNASGHTTGGSNNPNDKPPPVNYASGRKSGDLLPPIPQTNFVPGRNSYHGTASSRTNVTYLTGVNLNHEVLATSLDKIGVHRLSPVSEIADLGQFGVAIGGSLYLAGDPLTSIQDAQMKMHVMAIIDPNGGTTLIDQNLAGRTDQLFLNAGQLTFDGNQRLYFTSNGRLRYIDLETREVFSVTSENLTVERYDLVPPSGKIYFRARSWRTNVRALYELMPDLTARPLSTSTNAYSFNQSYLWTGTGLHRDMNTWEDFLFKSSLQLPTINRQATQTDIAGFKVTMTGVKAATITNGIPVNSNLVSFNGRLSFDGSNLFSYEVSGSRLKTVLEKKIKYPPRLLNNSNLGLTVMSAQSPGTANSPVWISISGTSDGLILLRYLDLANAPDQYLVSNSSNADKVLDIDGKLYLYSSSQYFLLEVSGSTATATPVTTPPWSGFDLVHDGKLYDFSGNKVLRFNFTMSRWDELFQIPPPSGCSLTKNSIVAGADGKPLGIVQIDCGTVRNVYAVAYVGWDNLSWETSSKLTNKIWTSNSLIMSITHLISRANENMIRIDGNMLVLSAELANPKTIELKSENIEIAGWTNVQLPADFHSTNSLSNTFGPESAIFIESSQSPLRRIFLANLNTGVAREIEPLRGIDLIDSVALSNGEYFLSGEKDGGTSTSAVMVKPDLTWQAVTLPESLDISRWVKRQQ